MNKHVMLKQAGLVWLLVTLLVGLISVYAHFRFGAQAKELQGISHTLPVEKAVELVPLRSTPAGFDPARDEYVLRAWSKQGMLHISDAEPVFSLLPAGSVLEAQLIRRDTLPEISGGDGSISIKWKILPPVGTDGKSPGSMTPAEGEKPKALEGEMKLSEDKRLFTSGPIPLMPYTSDGSFIPYPLVEVRAVDKDGNLLAGTIVTLPVSTELGCKNCHTGEWKSDGRAGISQTTAMDILRVHDFKNGTALTDDAASGSTVFCESCHLGGEGMPPNLSAALHGAHAIYIPGKDEDSCASCHPSSPTGATRFTRDLHADMGIGCVSCHGYLEDHALALLKAEQLQGSEAAARLMPHIPARLVPLEKINPREPWINQPDCTGCHSLTEKPDMSETGAFNKWAGKGPNGTEIPLFSERTEDTGTMNCSVCHGSPHAVFPSTNPYDENRDNLPALQYQKDAWIIGGPSKNKPFNCQVCHTTDDMGMFAHHELPGE